MKKRVGILTRIQICNNKKIHYIPSDIIYKLEKAVEIKIIYHTENTSYDKLIMDINACDGVILPGGDEIYLLELKLCKYLYEKNIPTLGICLGMQEMAYTFNGVIKTLKTNHHYSNEKYFHLVKINQNSKLYTILNSRSIMVNSRHHDFIEATNLKISAYANDNIIEAVEDPNKKFFIGVQWHPENLNDEYANKLFSYFISVL